jgi:hypothetical protein
MHYCRIHKPADILEIPDVEKSVHLLLGHGEFVESQIYKNAKVHDKAVDLRQEDKDLSLQPLYDLCALPQMEFFNLTKSDGEFGYRRECDG